MRILQVNTVYEKIGGAEVYMHLLADALREDGHAVGFCAGSQDGPIRDAETRVVERPEFAASSLIRDPEWTEAFTGFAREFRPDLVHVHNLWSLPADFPLTLGALGIPIVQTVHDFSQLCPNAWCVWPDGTVCEGGPGRKCFEHGCEENYPYDARVVAAAALRYHLIPRTFDAFLCPSAFLAEKLTAHGYPHAEGLPLWVATDGTAAADAPADAARDRRQILFLGRLVKEKGVAYLVEAMPRVLERVPDARLTIVGDGPERGDLEARTARLGLGDRVELAGKVPHERVADYFGRAAVQVLPSIWCENSPMSCYESYVAGLPMVASRIAGLPAMVREGETGLLATPRDPDDLADKLVRILTDDELRRRLGEGCRASLERFSKAIHMRRVREVYDEVRERRRERATPPLADPDHLAVLDRLMRQLGDVESWALGMRSHIEYLESSGRVERPLRHFGKHLLRSLRARHRQG